MSSERAYDHHVVRVVRGGEEGQPDPPPVRPAQHVQTLRLGHGQRLSVEGVRTQFEFYGGSFYMASRALSERLPYLGLTALQYDVWHTLLGVQYRGGIISMTQQQLADRLQTDRKEVGIALQRFTTWGLIYRPKRGRIRLNPLIAFYGSSEAQQEALADMPDDVPPITLPEARVRPRSRKPRPGPKGV